MSDWKPIETAPKDGTKVDLWCDNGFAQYRLTDCKWGREEYGEHSTWLNYQPDEAERFRYTWQEIGAKITHWMPLPEPPKEG